MTSLLAMSDGEWLLDDDSSRSDISEEFEADSRDGESFNSSRSSKAPVYKCMDTQSLRKAQSESMRRVVDVLNIEKQSARTLLMYHRWNVDSLFEKMANIGEEKLFELAGLASRSNTLNLESQRVPDVILCAVCFCDVPSGEATRMDCGHTFCNDCWTGYITVKISDGQSKRIFCMAENCSFICNEDRVRSLLPPTLSRRFELTLLESYVEDNSMVKWCPSVPSCGLAIAVQGDPDSFHEVECSCGQQFCFRCLREPHSPCSCEMWDLWLQKVKGESETLKWIAINTKPCPKCGKTVHKDGGCNLVGCQCGQAFCWLCGVATGHEHSWKQIHGHECGRFKEVHENETRNASLELTRFLHYESRWKAHLDSLRLERESRVQVSKRVNDLEASSVLVQDFFWLQEGHLRLFRTRQSLAHSYAFAYYMFGRELVECQLSSDAVQLYQNLFEDQQQQLEATVERLSGLLNFDPSAGPVEVRSRRMDIMNTARLAEQQCRQLHDVIETDFIENLLQSRHHVGPYQSQGVIKAIVDVRNEAGASTDPALDPTGVDCEGSGVDVDNADCDRKRPMELDGGGLAALKHHRGEDAF